MENLDENIGKMSNYSEIIQDEIAKILFTTVNDPIILFNDSFEVISMNHHGKTFVKQFYQDSPPDKKNINQVPISLHHIIHTEEALKEIISVCKELSFFHDDLVPEHEINKISIASRETRHCHIKYRLNPKETIFVSRSCFKKLLI